MWCSVASDRWRSPGWKTSLRAASRQTIRPPKEDAPRQSGWSAAEPDSERSQGLLKQQHPSVRVVRAVDRLDYAPQTGHPEAWEMAMSRPALADRFQSGALPSRMPTAATSWGVAAEIRREEKLVVEVRSRRDQLQIGVQTRRAHFQRVTEKQHAKKLPPIPLAARNCHSARLPASHLSADLACFEVFAPFSLLGPQRANCMLLWTP